jgi:hypothetical protein
VRAGSFTPMREERQGKATRGWAERDGFLITIREQDETQG